MSIEVTIDYGDVEVDACVEYNVTSWGSPARGPSFSSGGEPAEPPEFEITSILLTIEDGEYSTTWDDLSEKAQEIIDAAIYEELAEGPDDYRDEY